MRFDVSARVRARSLGQKIGVVDVNARSLARSPPLSRALALALALALARARARALSLFATAWQPLGKGERLVCFDVNAHSVAFMATLRTGRKICVF